MFSKYVLFKKRHLNKRAGVWTPWTPLDPPLKRERGATVLKGTRERKEGCEKTRHDEKGHIKRRGKEGTHERKRDWNGECKGRKGDARKVVGNGRGRERRAGYERKWI